MKLSGLLGGAAAALALAGGATTAQAHATGSLVFTDPTGTVAPTDTIDVFLTLTLDGASPALTTDNGVILSSGPTDDELTAAGFDLAQGVSTNLNIGAGCSGTFTTVCSDGPPYDFTFQFDNFNATLDVQPGADFTYLYGRFTPTGGHAPAGTYNFFDAGLFIQAFGKDTNGDNLHVDFRIADTCLDGPSAGCAFTRTVVGSDAPEPAAWLLMLAGFGGLGASFRIRRRLGASLA
jgi:hypothetical protein